MKDNIINAGSKYQIGGLPNHRVEEHLIVVKALIGRNTKLEDEGSMVILVDIEKFFQF